MLSFSLSHCDKRPLPITADEVNARGWEAVDVVIVSGDAYVDHPSFAAAILGRWLEAHGLRVAILAQPDWHSCDAWRTFGRPRLCFAISAGNMDSMVNRYTANRKLRSSDAFSPDGKIGCRPDRATLAYCQRAREAYRDVPIVAGGVEAGLRRIAHYDYWSDKVRRSILMDAKPDLLVYGMGERPLLEIVSRLDASEPVRTIRDVRGTAYRLGASEVPAFEDATDSEPTITLPDFEAVTSDRRQFADMTRLAYLETSPFCGRRMIQHYDREAVVINRPSLPLSTDEMDQVYGLPFTRQPHPSYASRRIPALETVRHSIQVVRGCFGGCAFCSLAAHQGRVIQSRSQESILEEVRRMAAEPSIAFTGTITDLGGPTANMYGLGCSNPEQQKQCRRTSCLFPKICKNLATDHRAVLELMRAVRELPEVRHVLIASGIRTDLAACCPEYIDTLATHHVGGHLSVAPEHVDPDVLRLMHKPSIGPFEKFADRFNEASEKAGKRQYLIPYLIAGHPGSDLDAMIRVAQFLKQGGYRVQQVQEFLPAPFDLATCMYYTGIDPMSGQEVYVARGERERRMQKALLLADQPENYRTVREALTLAGREDLIGSSPDCLIPSRPPQGSDKKRGQNKNKNKKTFRKPRRR
ncbi:MAG: YgiQ family radical SAM protein [Planctomycetia bacterium]|jgi:uncharacterized radical SAM protein YgiQ